MYRFRVLKRKISQKLRGPIWTRHPSTLQLDTHNRCNLNCTYCNVRAGGSFDLPRGKMSSKTIETVLEYFKGFPLWSVAPFMNGEPLLDDRLPQICGLADELCHTSCLIDTNGTLWEQRRMLVHYNLRLVRFTISAVTPETYGKVHGKPLFEEAMCTFNWFRKHKLCSQTPWLHFITTKDNVHEVDRWVRTFRGVGRTVFPVHRSPQYQLESEATKTDELTEPFIVDAKNHRQPLRPARSSKTTPCPNWSILAIGWNGEIMQCCDFPYKFNYGKVGEVDLLEAWQERNKNKMDNACCNDCFLRFPNWKKIMDRYVR